MWHFFRVVSAESRNLQLLLKLASLTQTQPNLRRLETEMSIWLCEESTPWKHLWGTEECPLECVADIQHVIHKMLSPSGTALLMYQLSNPHYVLCITLHTFWEILSSCCRNWIWRKDCESEHPDAFREYASSLWLTTIHLPFTTTIKIWYWKSDLWTAVALNDHHVA